MVIASHLKLPPKVNLCRLVSLVVARDIPMADLLICVQDVYRSRLGL